jgi:hypothetical protein
MSPEKSGQGTLRLKDAAMGRFDESLGGGKGSRRQAERSGSTTSMAAALG